jgi:hypothetical protein
MIAVASIDTYTSGTLPLITNVDCSISRTYTFSIYCDIVNTSPCSGTAAFTIGSPETVLRLLSSPTFKPTPNPNSFVNSLYGIAFVLLFGPSLIAIFLDWSGFIDAVSDGLHEKAFEAFKARANPNSETEVDYLYKDELLKCPTYFGIVPFIFPNGVPWMGLEPGAFEDYLRHLLDEHHILSMYMCDRLHPYARVARAITFLAIHGSTFMVYFAIVEAQETGQPDTAYLIQFLVAVPIQVFVATSISTMIKCECCFRCSCIWYLSHEFALLVALVLALLTFLWIWLFLTIVSETGMSTASGMNYIFAYMYEIVVVSAGLEMLLTFRFFVTMPPHVATVFNMLTMNVCRMKKLSWHEERTNAANDQKAKDEEVPEVTHMKLII